MGQKVNPYGFRLGFNKTWHSRWFAGKTYAETLHRDLKLRDELQKMVNGEVYINIQEIQRPELDAQLVAENIATQLERRIAFRRAMKKAMESAFRFGAKGIKVRVGGRLNGAEIARTEWYQDGRLPLHTLKADIDYGLALAKTTYGIIGVKVWIFKGEMAKARSRRRPQ